MYTSAFLPILVCLIFSSIRWSSASVFVFVATYHDWILHCGHGEKCSVANRWSEHTGFWIFMVGSCITLVTRCCNITSVLSVGAATISDIYKLEERGTAMGVFFGVNISNSTKLDKFKFDVVVVHSSRTAFGTSHWWFSGHVCFVEDYASFAWPSGFCCFHSGLVLPSRNKSSGRKRYRQIDSAEQN